MSKIIIDPMTAGQLANVQAAVELCDPSGNVLGYFAPKVDPSLYEQVEPPISEEELQQIEREPGGRTLREILDDLESQP